MKTFIGKDGKIWPETFDSYAWADAWLEACKTNPMLAYDREAMMGWFANAIMRGYDEHAAYFSKGSS